MKVGDVVKFVGSWSARAGKILGKEKPHIGVVTGTWCNGRTRKLSSADVLWDNGTHGNILVHALEVISESR